jgi:hypothetical protein
LEPQKCGTASKYSANSTYHLADSVIWQQNHAANSTICIAMLKIGG